MLRSDTYKQKGQRRDLIEILRGKGIDNEAVLKVIGETPRHLFVNSLLQEQAYEDKPLSIEGGQTISQPFTVAYQTQLLQLENRMKVLEIGTGSGYQFFILHKMGVQAYSVERNSKLHKSTKLLLSRLLGHPPKVFFGDGTMGLNGFAPFDRILVTAAAPNVPQSLIDQLAIGGKLVIPVGERSKQTMMRITKESKTKWSTESFSSFKFVPLIGREGWQEE